jgi:hypothetical protein
MSGLPKEIRNNLRKEAPVSLRLDPFDVSMVNALPVRKVFHTRNSWPSGFTKGSTKKRKLLLNESPKALACGVFASTKCRAIEGLVLKQLKNELRARVRREISYSWLEGDFARNSRNLLRNSSFPTKPIALSLFSSTPCLFTKTAVGIPLIWYFFITSS